MEEVGGGERSPEKRALLGPPPPRFLQHLRDAVFVLSRKFFYYPRYLSVKRVRVFERCTPARNPTGLDRSVGTAKGLTLYRQTTWMHVRPSYESHLLSDSFGREKRLCMHESVRLDPLHIPTYKL